MGKRKHKFEENPEEFAGQKHIKTTHLKPDEKKLIVVLSGAQLETVKVSEITKITKIRL